MSAAEPTLSGVGPDDLAIGRQLHDIVVPQLFVLTTGLAVLERRSESHADRPLVADLVETATQALSDLRAISRGEPASSSGSVGAVVARLQVETRTIGRLTGCVVDFRLVGDALIAPAFGLDLVAFVWEAIANSLRHGEADQIDVVVEVDEHDVVVVVGDNGVWREPADVWGSGIRGLDARAARWSGHVTVEGSADGTRIAFRAPLPEYEGRGPR